MDKLRISDNKRYFVKADGTPFTWLADTDWTMPQRLKWDDAQYLMKTRKSQGFTVLQIVALDPEEDLEMRSPAGAPALIDGHLETPNERYFEYLDWLIDEAERQGLYVLLLPAWGQLVVGHDWAGHFFEKTVTEANAYDYGKWIGHRYRDKNHILWCLGGDRQPIHLGVDYKNVWRRMAEGLAKGVTGRDLKYNVKDPAWEDLMITYHACYEVETGECSTMSYWTDEEAWISYIMLQSGHNESPRNYEMIAKEYNRAVTMPVWDGEPAYEMMPTSTWPFKEDTTFHGPWMVRKRAYWALLAGAFGHTYGHASVWSSTSEKARTSISKYTWYEGLHSEGAGQIKNLRAFMDSVKPQLGRPCQEILPDGNETAPNDSHLQANINEPDGTLCVYFPSGGGAKLDLGSIWGQDQAWLWWFRPADGKFYKKTEEAAEDVAGDSATAVRDGDLSVTEDAVCLTLDEGRLYVEAPTSGAEQDWLLILKKEAGQPPVTRGKYDAD